MEEYKLYNLQVMTRSEIGTRGTHVLAPGRNPEEAEQDYLREYPSKRGTSIGVVNVKEVKIQGFKITLEKLV